MTTRAAACAIALLLTATPAVGQVIGICGVVDGDTIAVGQTKVRLAGIDAPEAGQTCLDAAGRDWPCGTEATARMIALCDRKAVACRIVGTDRYGRTLGVCGRIWTVQWESLNAIMVREGWARAYVRYSSEYESEEQSARAARAGIWRGSHVAPWDYRKTLRTEK